MRVLMVSTPGGGHITPLLPLIGALRAQGDEVSVAAGPEADPIVAPTGAQFTPAGLNQRDMLARLATRIRGVPGDGLPPSRIIHYFLPRAFAEVALDAMIDDVIGAGRAFAPDLVVFEAFALAGPLVADLLGVPAVSHLFGPVPQLDAVALANDAVSPIWRAFDRDVPGWAGMFPGLTIEICPPSLETTPVPTGATIGLRPTPLPASGPTATSRPRVYVTFGTLFNENLDLFRLALDALAGLPVEVVATIGRNQDPAALAPHPPNARVERFIPQADLLPSCRAIVHHGGAGTMFGALAHAVPQVIVPQGADNFEHTDICERAGVAIGLRPGELTPASLADAVQRVLETPSYRTASNGIAAEIAAMPDAATVARVLRERYAPGPG